MSRTTVATLHSPPGPHSPIGRGSGLKIRPVSVRVRLGARGLPQLSAYRSPPRGARRRPNTEDTGGPPEHPGHPGPTSMGETPRRPFTYGDLSAWLSRQSANGSQAGTGLSASRITRTHQLVGTVFNYAVKAALAMQNRQKTKWPRRVPVREPVWERLRGRAAY
jgi:hypothetical protein